MMVIISLAIINGIKFEYKNKYLGWIAIALFFGFVFNWHYPLIMGFGYNAGTIEANLHFILSLFATFCVCSTVGRNDFVRIAKAITFSSILVAIYAFLQVIHLDPMKKLASYRYDEHRHVCALLDHPDILGNYLAISFPFILYLFKPKYIIPFFIICVSLFFSGSTLSMGAAIVGLLVFYTLRYRSSKYHKIALAVVLIWLVGLCFLPRFNKLDGGFTGRAPAWKMLIERADNPIFGQGLGIVKGLNVRTGKDGSNVWTFAHNDYIEMYCAGGIILLFLFALLVIDALRKFNYKQDNVLGFAYLASFISFLIIMVGSFPMEIAPLALGGLISFWGVQKLSQERV